MTSQPEILMTIKDRNVILFECNAPNCTWVLRTPVIGSPISTEREALKHLKTHDKQAD